MNEVTEIRELLDELESQARMVDNYARLTEVANARIRLAELETYDHWQAQFLTVFDRKRFG